MSIYGELLGYALNFMNTDFSLFGWTVSYWDAFIFSCILEVIGIVLYAVLHW